METIMSMREFIRTMSNDIDVYNNVTDEIGVCYCPPMEFTEEGEREFRWTLDNVSLSVNESEQWAEVICDDDEEHYKWQYKKRKAFDLLWAMAGYCNENDYNKWFKEE